MMVRITDRSVIEPHRRPQQHPLATLVLRLLGTTEQTRPPGGNETGLLTLCGFPGDGRGFTDMLMVTTTVRMVDGVHSNTTSLGPGVALGSELEHYQHLIPMPKTKSNVLYA